MALIFPSLISGNILNLEKQIHELDPYADGYHLDIMDFNFVPNLTWGPSFVSAIRKISSKNLHVHLMIADPAKHLDKFSLALGDCMSIHIERLPDYNPDIDYAMRCLKKIKEMNLKACITLKPSTKIESLAEVVRHVDEVLLMSVEPGFSGQEFLETSYRRLEELINLKTETQSKFTISMDGGINQGNIEKLARMGVDSFGIASGIFGNQNPVQALKDLKKLAM